MLRKNALLSLLLFIVLIFTSACGSGGSGSCDFFGYPTTPETKTITLSKYKFTLDVGTNDKIIAYVNGEDKTNEVKYTPIKEEFTKDTVATVERGLITALKAGTSIFKVSYTGADSVNFTVTVNDPTLPTLEVVKNEINLEYGTDPSDIESIIVTLNGKDVTSEATFISTNENVATVDENGNINIVGEGETQIIIHLDGANDQVVTIKVTLPELEINKNEINLQVGEEAENQQKDTDDLTVKLRGEDKIGEATFTSSDESVATVDENGHITAVSEGEAIITVSVDGAKRSEVKVNVYDPENHKIKCHAGTNMYETEDGFVMYKGETGNITILIGGVDKTAGGVYTSADETIVKVDNENEHGKMYALEIGTTSINLHHEEALEGDVKVNVIVKPKPTIQTDYMLIGNTQQIIFNGNAENWTFTSDDNNIASVDSTGKITSKGVNSTGTGSTIIHAYDGIKTHDFTINTYKTLDNNQNGVSSTLLIDEERQQMLTILMDTGMISNENDIQDIVQIDDNGMTEIKITIDRENGQKVAVVVYKEENGRHIVKYISTETVQSGEVTVNVGSSAQNTVAEENTSGTLETIVTPGFYNANDKLIASWQDVTGDEVVGGRITGNQIAESQRSSSYSNTARWDYAREWDWHTTTQESRHMYNILNTHSEIRNATKLVIPDGVKSIGNVAFYPCQMSLNTVVFPNSYTKENVGNTMDGIRANMQNYTIRSDNPTFDSVDGIIYLENHEKLVICPQNKTKVKIEDTVTDIAAFAFQFNESTSIGPVGSGADIEVPNTVKSIHSGSLEQMPNLVWCEFWDGLELSESCPLHYCQNLKSVFIPKTVTTIKEELDSPTNTYYNLAFNSPNVNFYCERKSSDTGYNWSSYWNARGNRSNLAPVTWNVSRTTYRNNYRQ